MGNDTAVARAVRLVARITAGVALTLGFAWSGCAPPPKQCFVDNSLPGAVRLCCPKGPTFSCGPWSCDAGFLDCNSDLSTAHSNGCECGPCAFNCSGASCGVNFSITFKLGQECDALPPSACTDGCAPPLTCGPNSDGFFHVCCGPQRAACSNDGDCCKTGPGISVGFEGACVNKQCATCTTKLGDACGPSVPCCADAGLACIDGKCLSCVPETFARWGYYGGPNYQYNITAMCGPAATAHVPMGCPIPPCLGATTCSCNQPGWVDHSTCCDDDENKDDKDKPIDQCPQQHYQGCCPFDRPFEHGPADGCGDNTAPNPDVKRWCCTQ